MASDNKNGGAATNDGVKHSAPIAIRPSATRRRSASVSSNSSGSMSSSSELPTPVSASASQSRVFIPSPGTSPILSYFLAQSPTKTPATFPFKRNMGPAPVFEEEEFEKKELPAAAHARRASTAVAGRFGQTPSAAIPEPQHERGAGLLRRLSLSTAAFSRPDPNRFRSSPPPSAPPNSAVTPNEKSFAYSRESVPRRSATVGRDGGRRRAPSPMGERILKGHFDGFN